MDYQNLRRMWNASSPAISPKAEMATKLTRPLDPDHLFC